MDKCPKCGGKLERDGFCNYCGMYFDRAAIENAATNPQTQSTVMLIRKRNMTLRLCLGLAIALVYIAAFIVVFTTK